MKSVKEECLSKLILFGEKSLRHALRQYVVHHHHERNHQGRDNLSPRFRTLVERNDPDDETLATIEAHLGSHRILCVTNADVARINGFFQRAQSSRLGEPVMMLRNDHERGLFNGDSGVSLRSGIVFKGRSFDPVLLERDLAPAYAVSVHKSQGSEYDHVALVLPKPDHPLLTRELLYTAMTRARKSVTILGSRDALAAGISRIVERSTGILEQLAWIRFLLELEIAMEAGGSHHLPHLHAYYQEHVGIYGIDPVELIAGSLPRRQERLVLAWAELHKDDLLSSWNNLQGGRPPSKIEPLR